MVVRSTADVEVADHRGRWLPDSHHRTDVQRLSDCLSDWWGWVGGREVERGPQMITVIIYSADGISNVGRHFAPATRSLLLISEFPSENELLGWSSRIHRNFQRFWLLEKALWVRSTNRRIWGCTHDCFLSWFCRGNDLKLRKVQRSWPLEQALWVRSKYYEHTYLGMDAW